MKSKKPYTWEEIKDFLAIELEKSKHIMTFGTIGSCNVERDIDVIITKKSGSKTSDFYKEIHKTFNSLNKYLLKKYKAKAVCFVFSTEEFLIRNLSDTQDKDLIFHTMVYLSFPQIERDWSFALFENTNMKDILLENYSCILGNKEMLFKENFQNKSHYDPAYLFLSSFNRINSHYPEQLLVKEMNHNYDYIIRKILKLEPLITKNKEQVKEYFYKICDIIDELDKKKSAI